MLFRSVVGVAKCSESIVPTGDTCLQVKLTGVVVNMPGDSINIMQPPQVLRLSSHHHQGMKYLLTIFFFSNFKYYRPPSPGTPEPHISSSQADPEIEENIPIFDDPAILPDAQHISDEDQLPSDPSDIPVDDEVLVISADEVDEDYFTTSDSDFDSQDVSDSESEVSEQDTQSDIAIEYDDEGELPTHLGATTNNSLPIDETLLSSIGRQNIENHLRQKIVSQKFTDSYPTSNAGVPITNTTSHPIPQGSYHPKSDSNPYSPFSDRMNWEIARWAKLRGPGSTAVSELLSIDGVCYKTVIFLLKLVIFIFI